MPMPNFTESQSLSYKAEGSLYRDISPVLTNIDPDKTPFLSNMPDGEDAHEMTFEWQLDHLRPPKKNQRLEYDEYDKFEEAGSVGRMSNNCQIFRVDGYVSDVMQKAWKTYNPKQNELARVIEKRTKELAHDIEYAIIANVESNAEIGGTTPAMTGGIPYFLEETAIDVTISGNKMTAAKAHHLETGKWVYLKDTAGGTTPAGLAINTPYYIRVAASPDNPTTDFYLYASAKDAIEDADCTNPLTLTAGTGIQIVMNNVVDAGNSAFNLTQVNDAVQMVFMRGGDATEAWMSARNKRKFSQLLTAVHVTNRDQGDHRVDDVVTVYETDFGVIKAQAHRDLPDDAIYLLDNSYWKLRWFDRAHVIPQDKLAKSGSYEKFVATATMGLEGTQPLASAAILNIG